MKIWIVSVESESCDNYGPLLFASKPTEEQLKQYIFNLCPYEFPDGWPNITEDDWGYGPGEWGSQLHVGKPEEQEIIELE